MSGLSETCRDLFGTDNLYEVLSISKDASQTEIKRGYHKLSLKVHPDRVEDDKEEATKKFQALGKLYSVLSDKDKKALYDESGEVDEEDGVTQDKDWYEYWRLLFAKISVKDIEEFEKKYKGSDEEINDLKSAYMDYEGDMDQILDSVMCATVEDEERFKDILTEFINKKELPNYKKFTKEIKSKKKDRKKRAAKEAQEADDLAKELGVDESDSLKSLILKNQQSRESASDDFFAQLEAKYSKPKKSKKGK